MVGFGKSGALVLDSGIIRCVYSVDPPETSQLDGLACMCAARAMVAAAETPAAGQSTLLFRQLFDSTSCTFTYILADSKTKDAVLIDPVVEQVRHTLCRQPAQRAVSQSEADPNG